MLARSKLLPRPEDLAGLDTFIALQPHWHSALGYLNSQASPVQAEPISEPSRRRAHRMCSAVGSTTDVEDILRALHAFRRATTTRRFFRCLVLATAGESPTQPRLDQPVRDALASSITQVPLNWTATLGCEPRTTLLPVNPDLGRFAHGTRMRTHVFTSTSL